MLKKTKFNIFFYFYIIIMIWYFGSYINFMLNFKDIIRNFQKLVYISYIQYLTVSILLINILNPLFWIEGLFKKKPHNMFAEQLITSKLKKSIKIG